MQATLNRLLRAVVSDDMAKLRKTLREFERDVHDLAEDIS